MPHSKPPPRPRHVALVMIAKTVFSSIRRVGMIFVEFKRALCAASVVVTPIAERTANCAKLSPALRTGRPL